MAAQGVLVTAGIPVYNEEANLAALLERLRSEEHVGEVLAVDDWSSDTSPQILQSFAQGDSRVRVFRPEERSGQLAGWIRIAQEARYDVVVFVDGDAMPSRGAIDVLRRRLNDRVPIASGRVVAANPAGSFPAARFRVNVLHRVRALGFAKEAIIGRFFAVRREWFLQNAGDSDIIANDAYLGCLARRQGFAPAYEPLATCSYTEAQVTSDFAAQRQRADAGYAQLRERGVMRSEDEPKPWHYAGAIFQEALADPFGAAHWIWQQLRSKFIRAYRPKGRDIGGWETQPTTKRRLG